MKPEMIFVLVLIFLIPISSFAQESSSCPSGSYHGLDNMGNDTCRDIKTNKIIESSANTSQIFNDVSADSSIFYLLIIGILVIVIIVILAKHPKSYLGRGRRNSPKYTKPKRYSKPRKKISEKTIIRIIGVIILISGSLFGMKIDQGSTDFQGNSLIFFALLIIGFVMIVQLKGLKNLATPNCQCCDCLNCGRNHNHWTHRADDDRHHRGW